MQYQLQYNLCAVAVYTVVLSAHLTKKKTLEVHNRLFTVLVATGLMGAVINILNTSANAGRMDLPVMWLEALNYASFIFINASPFIYFLYTISLCGSRKIKRGRWKDICIFLPVFIEAAVIFGNPFTHMIFYYENGVYARGSYQIILYLISAGYGVAGVVCVLRHREEKAKSLVISLMLFSIIGCATTCIQFFHQDILLQHFGIAICELLIFLNLQKPEESIETSLGVFNKDTFERLFLDYLAAGREFGVVLLHVEEMELLQQMLGSRRVNRLRRVIAEYLEKLSERNVYYLRENTFCVICRGELYTMIQDILKRIEARFKDDFIYGDGGVNLSCCMVSLNVPDDIDKLDVLYGCCSYLKKMKSCGNCIVTTNDIHLERANRELMIEQCLKRGIKERSFEVYYQPIHAASSKKLVSAEALVRLKDSKNDFLSPEEFIPIAERNGTIIQISEIIYEKIFQFLSEHDLEQYGIKYVEINMSVVQFMQENLVPHMLDMLERYHIKKGSVNFEITETAAKDSPKLLLDNMKRFYHEGIRFSLDDFGVGYSNINSLMALPLDIIKFDRSMIQMASDYDTGKTVLQSAAAMVQGMGHKIVAEGVERAEQLEFIKEIGIDYIQGYYFSKPLPEDSFLEYIEFHKS